MSGEMRASHQVQGLEGFFEKSDYHSWGNTAPGLFPDALSPHHHEPSSRTTTPAPHRVTNRLGSLAEFMIQTPAPDTVSFVPLAERYCATSSLCTPP